jgi:hypothetical protein
VPASTARGWLAKSKTEVVSLDVLDLDTIRLQHEAIRPRRQIWKLTTLLRLAMIVLKVSGFSFARVRLADGSDKQRLMDAIERARSHSGQCCEQSACLVHATTIGTTSAAHSMTELPAPEIRRTNSLVKKSTRSETWSRPRNIGMCRQLALHALLNGLAGCLHRRLPGID